MANISLSENLGNLQVVCTKKMPDLDEEKPIHNHQHQQVKSTPSEEALHHEDDKDEEQNINNLLLLDDDEDEEQLSGGEGDCMLVKIQQPKDRTPSSSLEGHTTSVKDYCILYFYLFLYFLTFGLLNPIAFELFERVYIAAYGDSHFATFMFGFFNSFPCLIFFCISPIVGNLSDKYGKKRFLIIFSILYNVIFIIYLTLSGLVSWKDEELISPIVWIKKNSIVLYAIACVIQGFALDIIPLINSLISNYHYSNSESNKDSGIFGNLSNLFSYVVAIMGLSTTIGSIISALVLKFMDIATVFGLILLVSQFSTFVLFKYLHEHVTQSNGKSNTTIFYQLVFPFKYIVKILFSGEKVLIFLIITKLLSTISSFAFFSTITQFTRYKYHFTPSDNGYLLTILGLCAILSNSLLSKLILKISRNSEKHALLLTCIFTALLSLYFILCPSGDLIYFGMLLLLIGAKEDALRTSLIISIFNKPEEQGTLNGCLGSISIIGRAIAPLLFSFVLNESREIFIDLPFVIILIIQIVGIAIVFKIIRMN